MGNIEYERNLGMKVQDVFALIYIIHSTFHELFEGLLFFLPKKSQSFHI